MAQRVYPGAWLCLFPAVYLVHLLDERSFSIGTASFATEHLGVYFTDFAWWAVNVPSMIVLTLVTVLVVREALPQWVAIALAIHLMLHALVRVPTSLWTLTIAPGLITGLLLCAPLAAATLYRARWAFSGRETVLGLAAGVASFQPLWHFVLLPLLPPAPAA